MTVDRDQVRRDAERDIHEMSVIGASCDKPRRVLALLAELEQADRKILSFHHRAKQAERARDEQRALKMDALHGRELARLDTKAEQARLAAVQKALDSAMQYVPPKDRDWIDALAAVEQAQEQR